MSGSLKHDDYVRLSPVLWERCLFLQEKASVLHVSKVLLSLAQSLIRIFQACFLCMQCAEKAHDKFVSLVVAHLQRYEHLGTFDPGTDSPR